jgi:uncharacterized membrane protein
MNNKVIGTVATLGLVLTVGLLTTIYSQQAFAQAIGGNGGDCTKSPSCNGIPGGTAGNGGTNNVGNGMPQTNGGHADGANANGGHVMNKNGVSHHQ